MSANKAGVIQWYYSKGGRQLGPVPESELSRLVASGEIQPETDLVWREGMDDWKPAAQVLPHLSVAPATTSPSPLNPYQAPIAVDPQPQGSLLPDLVEVAPGSAELEVGGCISRAFELTKRHFGMIIAVGALYLAVSWGIGITCGILETLVGGPGINTEAGIAQWFADTQGIELPAEAQASTVGSPLQIAVSIITNIIAQVASIFLSLGVTRIGLNLVSGQPYNIGMMFGGGDRLLRAVGASILYGLMVFLGLLLLIFPGIYLALKYGQYLNAIVDKDLGVFDSLQYSARITEGQKGNLFLLGLVCFFIVVAGLLALIVGVIFAYPIAWVATMLAYRWLQYGPAITRVQA
ncbi:MAG: DUF4339 domain-containing protein [Akkermansiaceae bacterium]|nr:DUF4339 domain-containing protein [Akkermansiaceae bacterium]